MRWRSKGALAAVAVAAATGLMLAGCSSSGNSSSSGGGGGGALSIGSGGVFTDSNNPFASTSSASSDGWRWLIYEPLVQNNDVNANAKPTPWLASAFSWNSTFTSATFTARSGVKWSDGKPFTAADIAYTFTLLKNNAALNSAGIPITSVTQHGNQVTVAFSGSQYVNQAATTGQFIVPEHIWKSVSNPATYQDTKPVGTGPFIFQSTTSSVAKLTKNPTYWQASKVKVDAVVYQALQGNDPILNELAAHKLDWAGAAALNLKTGFLDKDPKHNFSWSAPVMGISSFIVNDAKAPFNNVHLRNAMNLVIDRPKIIQLSSANQYPIIKSVTGLPQPIANPYIASEFSGKDYSIDLAAAKQQLAEGGFKLSGGVLTDSTGKPVTMNLTDPSGWTDYLTALQVISQNFAELGIKTTTTTPSQDAWNAALATGDFDGAMLYSNSGPTPYDIYATYADGSQYKPIGTQATGDVNRYNNSEVTAALDAYKNASSESARTAAMKTIQTAWAADTPVMPIWASSAHANYTTANFTGWPSASNPYADPGVLSSNMTVILTRLQPAK